MKQIAHERQPIGGYGNLNWCVWSLADFWFNKMSGFWSSGNVSLVWTSIDFVFLLWNYYILHISLGSSSMPRELFSRELYSKLPKLYRSIIPTAKNFRGQTALGGSWNDSVQKYCSISCLFSKVTEICSLEIQDLNGALCKVERCEHQIIFGWHPLLNKKAPEIM